MPTDIQKFVLLCEDEQIIRLVFERVIGRHPEFLLDSSADVEDAISKVKTVTYDVIFLDLSFGDDAYAGMKVLREVDRQIVRSQANWRGVLQTPVIIMSGSDQVDWKRVMHEANSLGVYSFIDKPVPFTEDFLAHVLRRLGIAIIPTSS